MSIRSLGFLLPSLRNVVVSIRAAQLVGLAPARPVSRLGSASGVVIRASAVSVGVPGAVSLSIVLLVCTSHAVCLVLHTALVDGMGALRG